MLSTWYAYVKSASDLQARLEGPTGLTPSNWEHMSVFKGACMSGASSRRDYVSKCLRPVMAGMHLCVHVHVGSPV